MQHFVRQATYLHVRLAVPLRAQIQANLAHLIETGSP